MMCFRDMTFCTFYEDCANANECHRPLTPEIRAAAEKWWGGPGAPIAFFMSQPSCHTPIGEANEELPR